MATYYGRTAGGSWGTAATWSLTSGGGATGAIPTAADDIILDALSGNITVNGSSSTPSLCRSLTASAYVGTLSIAASTQLNVGDSGGGSFILNALMTLTVGGNLHLISSASGNALTTGGKTLPQTNLSAPGGSYTMTDNFTTGTPTLTISGGTFDGSAAATVFTTGGLITASGGALLAGTISVQGCTASGCAITAGAGGMSCTTITASAGSITTSTLVGTGTLSLSGCAITSSGAVTGFTTFTTATSGSLTASNIVLSSNMTIAGASISLGSGTSSCVGALLVTSGSLTTGTGKFSSTTTFTVGTNATVNIGTGGLGYSTFSLTGFATGGTGSFTCNGTPTFSFGNLSVVPSGGGGGSGGSAILRSFIIEGLGAI